MARHLILIIFTFIVAGLPAVIFGTRFIVGDAAGWTIGYDYKEWAKGKNFLVGDTLVFQYPVGVHNVFKVNGTEFNNCIIPSNSEPLDSGNDTIALASAGKKWYICGVEGHCNMGQKLTITVEAEAPTMAPSPSFY